MLKAFSVYIPNWLFFRFESFEYDQVLALAKKLRKAFWFKVDFC